MPHEQKFLKEQLIIAIDFCLKKKSVCSSNSEHFLSCSLGFKG